ncbi:MAG: EAL domain-containing response regulator [Actinomycetota bacterium]
MATKSPSEPTVVATRVLPAPAADPGVTRVLIVDANESTRELFARALHRVGLSTVQASNGVRALEIAQRENITLMLLDSQMPGLTGVEVLEQLRRRPETTLLPVVMVTAENGLNAKVAGLAAGADDYVAKPVDIEELVARVRSQLRRVGAWQEAVTRAADLEKLHARQQGRIDLARLVRANEHSVHFQPIIDLTSNHTVGFEALTRWADGTPPDSRLEEARSVGYAHQLERAMVQRAVESARALPPASWVSLNVSAAFVIHEATLPALIGEADRDVVIELTEQEAVEDYDALRVALSRFGAGLRLAIDDAGAGYASLRHILALEPSLVKLDIGWIRGIDGDRARQALVAGLQHFATETGRSLIAEGIETEAEYETLRGLGVPMGQGFFLGRPVAVDALGAMRSA